MILREIFGDEHLKARRLPIIALHRLGAEVVVGPFLTIECIRLPERAGRRETDEGDT